jgi:hypothetical protein
VSRALPIWEINILTTVFYNTQDHESAVLRKEFIEEAENTKYIKLLKSTYHRAVKREKS